MSSAVIEESQRQLSSGMSACDCSNCRPAEAEALWLAQPAMTQDNFDKALVMSESELNVLVQGLAVVPAAPPSADIRPVASVCGTDDPILDSPMLESLVTRLERAFHSFFYLKYPESSELSPDDFFGRDLAWDIAKNIDIITQPSDFELVLASEAIPAQFDHLFVAFCQWKNDLRTGPTFDEAKSRRASVTRGHTNHKVPQSCEGALLLKARAEQAKKALKVSRDQAKEADTLAKEVARQRRSQAKITADARSLSSNTYGCNKQCLYRIAFPENWASPTFQSSIGTSSLTQEDNTSSAPHQKREDRPAALSAKVSLIMLRMPVCQTLVTCGGGRARFAGVWAKASAA
ncbi:uncharacterized protein MELLADRAFT_114596 [Melampsora larici-populina 98AG31]|uniref:Uncharacterized protein n=1 Tax=Melampsora larici-populina (strain 98AG31 / pathotype 3-4-7) TaxID=747676 RepID=F4SE31_MELLP|nr:uncharacterized protein MELLADRAFT_114596 [Melampsora larici-populina 98AG31]EGF97092.1 hypothetical protein MELLADRAFT_114596 [Melampsora larici-populina 98AG31]